MSKRKTPTSTTAAYTSDNGFIDDDDEGGGQRSKKVKVKGAVVKNGGKNTDKGDGAVGKVDGKRLGKGMDGKGEEFWEVRFDLGGWLVGMVSWWREHFGGEGEGIGGGKGEGGKWDETG